VDTKPLTDAVTGSWVRRTAPVGDPPIETELLALSLVSTQPVGGFKMPLQSQMPPFPTAHLVATNDASTSCKLGTIRPEGGPAALDCMRPSGPIDSFFDINGGGPFPGLTNLMLEVDVGGDFFSLPVPEGGGQSMGPPQISLYVTDPSANRLFEVNLFNGTSRIVSDGANNMQGMAWSGPRGIDVLSPTELVVGDGQALFSVNPQTGLRTLHPNSNVGGNAAQVTVGPDGRFYVAHYGFGQLSVYDPVADTFNPVPPVLSSRPTGVAFLGNRLFALLEGAATGTGTADGKLVEIVGGVEQDRVTGFNDSGFLDFDGAGNPIFTDPAGSGGVFRGNLTNGSFTDVFIDPSLVDPTGIAFGNNLISVIDPEAGGGPGMGFVANGSVTPFGFSGLPSVDPTGVAVVPGVP
jgi:hypothetical protein